LFSGFLILWSCSGYEKLLKSDDYELKYEKALEYYEAESYNKAMTLFEQIIPVFRATRRSDTVAYYFAKSNYYVGDYILAGHYFKSFYQTYGNSTFAEEAEYLAAYCHYLLSPKPALDQQSTYEAIQAFRLYILHYPESEKVPEAKEYINELQEKLVKKSYLSARLYFDLGYYKSSIIALNNSLQEYPNTDFREEIMFLILKSRYLLADNSIASKQKERFQATLDEYYSFKEEFPESEYTKEAKKFFEETTKFLKRN
jgi:outer membrane protein assembly factor BamD